MVKESPYRWVIVAAGGLLGCIAVGAMFSLPVLLGPISTATGWTVAGISMAMTIGFLVMAFASMFWGAVTDRIGPRPVVLIGSVILAAALATASQAETLLAFQASFGFAIGLGVAAIFAPMMACVTGWFETQRSLAVSLVSAGMGTAPFTMSPLVAWLVTHNDWRTTLLIVAGIVAAVMIPVSFLVRRAPALETAPAAQAAAVSTGPEMTVGQAVRSPQFIVLMLTNFFCCATHSGPIFHTVSYAVACGIPLVAAVTIYSLEGVAGLGGRIAFGILGDKLGAKNVLAGGLLLQSVGALSFVFVANLGGFYSVAAFFGFMYAGIMPLYSVLARDNFPLRMMGTVIGGTAMAGGFGMALGPWAGGLIYDNLGGYTWLYVGACAMGIAAFLTALTFKPFAKPAPVAQPA